MFKIDFSTHTARQLIHQAQNKLNSQAEDWEKTIWQFIIDWFDEGKDGITVSTSGSTAVPKRIKHSRQAMLNSAEMTCKALSLQTGANCLLCLPAGKIGGMMMIVRCLYNKMNLYCMKPSSIPLAGISNDIKFDFAAFTPMQFHQILDGETILNKAERIDKVILGGEQVRGQLLKRIATLKNQVYLTFGMTETISHIALKKMSGQVRDEHFNTLPGIAVRQDERNCLVIDAGALQHDLVYTNDIINLLSPTQFDWVGRVDNVINTGGLKVQPELMEQKLLAEIEPAFFIGAVADELTGEKIVLAIETDSLTDTERNRINLLLSQFDKISRPRDILAIKRFERTDNGKIRRKETLELWKPSSGHSYFKVP